MRQSTHKFVVVVKDEKRKICQLYSINYFYSSNVPDSAESGKSGAAVSNSNHCQGRVRSYDRAEIRLHQRSVIRTALSLCVQRDHTICLG